MKQLVPRAMSSRQTMALQKQCFTFASEDSHCLGDIVETSLLIFFRQYQEQFRE
jgi:hypothetical protein